MIAEVAQAHDGSLGTAHAYIDELAKVGVDAVKFQTHIAAEESTLDEPFRVTFSRQDQTRYGYWQRMEFTEEQWAGLAQHARDKGLVFLSSAFSVAAVLLLDRLEMPAWKVGSGEFQSAELLGAMIDTKKPILFSTGMSTWSEIDAVVRRLTGAGNEFALLQCTSQYPTAPEAVGLNVLQALRQRYACPVGLSDHSGKIFAPVAAMALGADLVEAHAAFDKRIFGPDVLASLSLDDFRTLVQARDEIHLMNTHPVDKDRMAEDLQSMRELFSKSVAPSRALHAGELLTDDLLVPKKPGTGIPFSAKPTLVGRRVNKDVPPDRLLTWSDVE